MMYTSTQSTPFPTRQILIECRKTVVILVLTSTLVDMVWKRTLKKESLLINQSVQCMF